MERRAPLPEHGELRPAARAGVRRPPGRPRGVARRPHQLGGLDRVCRPRAGRLRASRRLPSRGCRRRCHRLRAGRARRRLAARQSSRARARDRVHLEPVPVARAGAARRGGAHGATRSAGGRRRRVDDAGGGQRRAVVERRRCRPRLGARGGRGGGRARARRRDPGLRVAAPGGGRLRLPRRPLVQVAALTARRGLPHGSAGAAGRRSRRSTPAGGRARTRSPTTTGRRYGSRRRRGGWTPRRPGSRGSVRRRRWNCSSGSASSGSTITTSGSRTAFVQEWGSSRATRRSSPWTSKTARRSSSVRASAPPFGPAACASRSTSTTREADVDAALDALV